MTRAVIFVNGFIPDIELVRRLIQPDDTLLAADGGTRHALALGLMPSVIIGDLDSLPPETGLAAERYGTRLVRHPRDKNETDFELALGYAAEAGYRQILVIGALGNRFDQTLGNLALLADSRFSTFDIRFDDGMEEVFFTRGNCRVEGRPGEIVSLIPWGGEVAGVTTAGLRWHLHSETLFPYKTRGISNELLGNAASVTIQSGLLLVVHRRQNGQS